jgi:hypothetical protein
MKLTKAAMGFCLGLAAVMAPPLAFAEDAVKEAPKPATKEAAPAAPAQVEPRAVELLKAASAALAAAKTVSFDAVATYERAAANGQPLFYSTVSKVTMQRPDKLRVITLGDGVPDEVYYDGKEIAAYIPSANLVAISDAPPTIDKLLDHLWDKAAIYFPFADVLASDPYEELAKDIHSAFYVGQSIAVGGVKTEVVAIAGDDAAGQIWLGAEDHLPRLIRVVYANEPAHAHGVFQLEARRDRRRNRVQIGKGPCRAAHRIRAPRRRRTSESSSSWAGREPGREEVMPQARQQAKKQGKGVRR